MDNITSTVLSFEAQASATAKAALFNTVFSSLPCLVGYVDCHLNYQYVNSSYAEWFCVSREHCLRSNIVDIIGELAFNAVKTNLDAALKGQEQSFEREIPYKTGGHKYVQVKFRPDRQDDGSVRGIAIIVQDLTEQKTREDRLRLILETMTDGFILLDSNGKVLQYNQATLSIFEITEDQLLSQTLWDARWRSVRADGSDFPVTEHPAAVALRTGKKVLDTIMGITLPSAEHRWININANPMRRIGQVGYDVLLTFSDITEHFQDKARIQASEERHRRFIDASNDGIWEWNPQTKVTYLSSRWKELIGYEDHELPNREATFFDRLHPEDKIPILESLRAHIEQRKLYRVEYRLKNKAGEYRWFYCRGKSQRNESGKIVVMYGTVTDITGIKQIELILRQKQHLLIELQELAKLGNWEIEIPSFKMIWSEQNCRNFGMSSNTSTPSYETFLRMIHPSDLSRMQEWIRACLEGGHPVTSEFRTIHSSGAVNYLEWSGKLVVSAENGSIRLAGTTRNITERKQAEEALKKSEKRLQLVLRGSKDAFWDWNIETGEVYYDPTWLKMMGYHTDDISFNTDTCNILMHPEDEPRVNRITAQVFESNSNTCEVEFRKRHKNGHYIPLLVRGFITRDASGKPIRMSGTSTDLTERKEIEKEKASFLAREQKAREDAEQANRIKDDFLATLSMSSELH
ncbi:unnamed protein product [Sphagnum tenellum]